MICVVLFIVLFGSQTVASQNCYVCSFVEGIGTDACTDENFDADTALPISCDGQCYTSEFNAAGVSTFTRSCDIGGALCDEGLADCCEGNLCNGAGSGGTNGGDSGDGGNGGDSSGKMCYLCLDLDGLGCNNENFNETKADTVTCSGSCIKGWTTSEDTSLSVRGCATNEFGQEYVCNENKCESGFGIKACQYCCQDDLCNGAGLATVVSGAVVFLSTIAVSVLVCGIF